MSPRTVDVVIIGSGINSLVAAAYLARAGLQVEVLERNPTLGGAIATEELTAPGYRHDTFSSWHPLFAGSSSYAELGEDLRRHGLRYVEAEVPTGSAYGDGQGLLLERDPAETGRQFSAADAAALQAELARFGEIAPLVGSLLDGELHSRQARRTAARLAWRVGMRGAGGGPAMALESAAAWLHRAFSGPEPELLYGPWLLHTGLAPGEAGGGLQLLALAGGLHLGGIPVVEGGSANFVTAFRRLIEEHGGTLRTDVDVTRVLVRGGRAVGVVAGEEELLANRAVVANVTAPQLYARLLAEGDAPPAAVAEAAKYRPNRAGMQIHLALSEPLRWRDSRLDRAAIVHVCDSLAATGLACAQAEAGLLPAAPTVVCGQPTVVDPSRAPEGKAIIWIQLQEAPYRPVGDARGVLDVGSDGWTDELVSGYTDRVIARIAEHAPNLEGSIVGRASLSPVELERRNINLLRGDIYAGATSLDQMLWWRPSRSYGSHRTPIEGLWQIGAATHPGPGLGGASGRIAAQDVLAGDRGRRLPSRLRRRAT